MTLQNNIRDNRSVSKYAVAGGTIINAITKIDPTASDAKINQIIDLHDIHTQLDHAVLAAYGWPHHLSDEQILERLLALNLKRSAEQS